MGNRSLNFSHFWTLLPIFFASLTLIIIIVAIITTKIPIWFGTSFGPFELSELKTYGFLSMAHEMRTDFAMLIGSFITLWRGSGAFSIDWNM